jgi:Spy/CpxP family protein refolding chaperone
MAMHGSTACEVETDTTKATTTTKFALIALGALAAVTLLAQYGAPSERTSPAALKPHPGQQAGALESLRAYLSLSDSQVEQLRSLSKQNRAATKATSDKLCSNRITLLALMNSSAESDQAKADRLVVESTGLRKKMRASLQELAEQAEAILTPGQQQKFAALASTVQAQQAASPRTMPAAWPMIFAAAELGLIASPTQGDGTAIDALSEPRAVPVLSR